jgi:hypothetical protein
MAGKLGRGRCGGPSRPGRPPQLAWGFMGSHANGKSRPPLNRDIKGRMPPVEADWPIRAHARSRVDREWSMLGWCLSQGPLEAQQRNISLRPKFHHTSLLLLPSRALWRPSGQNGPSLHRGINETAFPKKNFLPRSLARFQSTLQGCQMQCGSRRAPGSPSRVGMPERRHRLCDHLEQPRRQRGERRAQLRAGISRAATKETWRAPRQAPCWRTPLSREHHGDENLEPLHADVPVSTV